ncbi:MAG TPA: right-handed parallel beta-helix repeat-containing protein, partial [Sedimentisphaerales bacterium]|nr:right-handed parallel beta-helix repeat-containing protein [Sedimentisphaerales bacterium]
HTMAIKNDGTLWGWGNNGSGKLGVGDTNSYPEPTQMLCANVSGSIDLTITSEIQGSEPNCAKPFVGMGFEDNYIEYEICYSNPITNPSDPKYYGSVYNVNIIEHLPIEVNEPDYISGGGVYDSNAHTITWVIGELAPGDSNCFTVTTKVNKYARPGGEISNFVEMIADKYYSYTTDTVPVCNWGREIIYVDEDATNGYENGTSWDDAYTTLRDAFIGAQNIGSEITAIWVAAGTYEPVESTEIDSYSSYSFELFENMALFGHFAGTEESVSERDFSDANNETILEGQIGQNDYDAVYKVVLADNINSAVVDGFTIQGSYSGAGVYIDDANVAITNCKLKNNRNYGIQAINYSDCDIHNCSFVGNNYGGVYSNASQLDVSYCIFDGEGSQGCGIDMESMSSVSVNDCVFRGFGCGISGNTGVLAVEGSLFKSNSIGLDISYIATTLRRCLIKQSIEYGVLAMYSNLTIEKSVIQDSGTDGIYMGYRGQENNLDLISSVVRYNGQYGIYLRRNSHTNIKNCWIHNNGNSFEGSGIYFYESVEEPLVMNNTIYDNYAYGIYASQNGGDPNILNCIISGNGSNDLYRVNGSFSKVNYCLLQNTHSGAGNLIGSPGFKNIGTDANDLHIDETSQCKDAGELNGSYGDETDVDGESRVCYGRVDIGGDEYYLSLADFDEDGKVNFTDYGIFAAAWQNDSGDGNYYNETCDLEDNNSIDISDLSLFCEDWLWERAWDEGWMMRMSGGDSELESMSLMESRVSLESLEEPSATGRANGLMLVSGKESLATMPERLNAKSRKFYDITPERTISAKQKQLDAMEAGARVNIKEVLRMLDEFWLSGEFDKALTEKEYVEFREALEKSGF